MSEIDEKLLQTRRSQNAKNALAEAKLRRQQAEKASKLPKEVGGKRKAEPTRYGDWERNGITSDF